MEALTLPGPFVIESHALSNLFDAIRAQGYEIVAPTMREGAIVYGHVNNTDALPIGWTAIQKQGSYRLERRTDDAVFGFAVGPHSPKKYLLKPSLRLWRAETDQRGGVNVAVDRDMPPRLALIGVRSCELHAIAIQDRVMTGGKFVDTDYAARRNNLLIVAVNCMVAGGTCFCASMGTGPRAESGYDLALTELIGGGKHTFIVDVGSEAGAALMNSVPHRGANESDVAAAAEVSRQTAASMGRTLETDGIKELFYANLEHSRWDDVASRCLACTNCTMVCPTCFCTTIEDRVDLSGVTAERMRIWDSCFTMDFSHLHGGNVRSTIKARYRQWLTHKLASWIDQFGTSGCVGCGRCITWCPVGIDITEEAAAIRATDHRLASPRKATES